MPQELPVPRKTALPPFVLLSEGLELVRPQYWLFVGITAVGLILGSLVPFAILLGPMMCGIYMCYFARMRGEEVSFQKLFRGFDHFAESLIASLIVLGITLCFLIPVYVLMFVILFSSIEPGSGGPETVPWAALGVIYVLVLLVSIAIAVFAWVVYY